MGGGGSAAARAKRVLQSQQATSDDKDTSNKLGFAKKIEIFLHFFSQGNKSNKVTHLCSFSKTSLYYYIYYI